MISKQYGFTIKLDKCHHIRDSNYVCISNGGGRRGFIWNVKLDTNKQLFTDKEFKTNRISKKRLSYLLKKYVSQKDITSMVRQVLKSSGDLLDFYRDVLTFMGGDV